MTKNKWNDLLPSDIKILTTKEENFFHWLWSAVKEKYPINSATNAT